MRHIPSPVIIPSISFGMKAPVRNRRNNICIWLITDHKLAIEDIFVKLGPTDINTTAPITTWLAVLNDFAVSDIEVSCWADWVFCCADWVVIKFQLPEFKIYPELQISQIEESVTVHIWQFPTVHLSNS